MAECADVLQVGARNVQNFALLRRLAKVERAVLLKRGPSATVHEWLLAAEYLLSDGNSDVILCERGIRAFDTGLRNTLDLAGALHAQDLSHLPVIVDPSHATRRRRLVARLSLAAVAAGLDGMMVEVHPAPDQALSDGPQSLGLHGFAALMAAIPVHAASAPAGGPVSDRARGYTLHRA